MKFVDSCEVVVRGGKGGNGAVAFRREKFVPFGGPSGGDGGRGGDVVFVVDPGISTLLDLTYVRAIEAGHGENGQGADCYGRGAEDRLVRVPLGTQVWDREADKLLFDLGEPDMRVVVAKGGKGGRGNMHFATSFDRAPRRSEPGDEGEERALRLELKVMADVGLLGFPNVGKSTFIAASSRARPKVADYPFTTLVPSLGVVRIDEDATFVMADIPGLIPGAADGAGLGIRFLKHVERTRALLHLLSLDYGEGREPFADYEAIRRELAKFDPELARRPTLVALTKADLPDVREAYEGLKKRFMKKKVHLYLVSAATGEGVKELLRDLFHLVRGEGPAHALAALEEPEPKPKKGAAKKSAKTAAPAAKSKKKKPEPAKKAAPAKKSAKAAPAPAKKKTKPGRETAAHPGVKLMKKQPKPKVVDEHPKRRIDGGKTKNPKRPTPKDVSRAKTKNKRRKKGR
ncbi:MAG: GTPase ObgE [Polyangiaceae bacterium]|nr:GTPase ObgE [Polyangiaceae bacterium]